MASQFGGFIMHGVGTRVFVFDDELGKDANLWTTMLWRVLVDKKKRRDAAGIGVLPLNYKVRHFFKLLGTSFLDSIIGNILFVSIR
jgi:hypothetical protein